MNDFIKRWCDERHGKIDEEFKTVWKRMDTLQKLFLSVIITLIANFAGIVVLLVR